IASAKLERAGMLVEERHEIVGLENLVAELGVGDSFFGPPHPRPDGFLRNHRTQWKMLADIAQEGNDLQLCQPLVIVGKNGRRLPFKIYKPPDLILQTNRPFSNLRFRVELPFTTLSARISDQARPTSNEDDRPMSGTLEPAERQERE